MLGITILPWILGGLLIFLMVYSLWLYRKGYKAGEKKTRKKWIEMWESVNYKNPYESLEIEEHIEKIKMEEE